MVAMVQRWKPWTNDERREAVRLALARESAETIASALGRTLAGVKFQLTTLGVRLNPVRQWGANRHRERDWTTEEDEEAIELLRLGWQLWRIGEELGRSTAAVSARLKRIGVPVGRGRTLSLPVDTPHRPGRPPGHEPTEAELDALIEQQRRNLPPWWHAETERERKADEARRLGTLPALARETSAVARLGREFARVWGRSGR